MHDLKMYEKHNGDNPVEYGFGPEWVAMAMYMDDYPRFYTEDMAVLYWFRTIKEKDVLDWYHNDYKEAKDAETSTAKDQSEFNKSGSDSGHEADGPSTEAKGKARKGKRKTKDKESADMGGGLRRDDYYWRGLAEYWEA